MSAVRYAWTSILLLTVIGCQSPNSFTPGGSPTVSFAARLAEAQATPDTTPARVVSTGGTVHLHRQAELANADVARTTVKRTADNRYGVTVELTTAGAARLAAATGAGQGKLLAILLNGKVIMAPRIHAPLGGTFEIESGWDEQEARDIAMGITGHR